MRRCPRCDAVADGDQTTCGSCGQALGSAEPRASGAERPAHLAILDSVKQAAPAEQVVDGAEGASAEPAARKSSKPRLVSRAGPAVPVTTNKNDDSVPSGSSGWMARLDQAKRVGQPEAAQPPPLEKAAQKGPPPLKKKAAATGNGAPALTQKPAHLLVAELEAQERERKERARRAAAAAGALESAEDEISKSEIAQVEMPKPEARINKKKTPTWVLATVAVLAVGGAAAGGIYYAQREPPPPAPQVDPELVKQAERQKEALAALNEGHALFGVGKDKEKIDQAIVLYARAIELEPTLAKAERALGVAHAAKGDDAEAVKHYKRFLELDPMAPEASQVRAIIEKYEKLAGKKK